MQVSSARTAGTERVVFFALSFSRFTLHPLLFCSSLTGDCYHQTISYFPYHYTTRQGKSERLHPADFFSTALIY
jgi:hypothetical protein